MRTQILVLSLAAGLLGLAACDIDDLDIGGSERSSQDFHYSYPMQPGGRLSVENSNGSVEIFGLGPEHHRHQRHQVRAHAGIARRAARSRSTTPRTPCTYARSGLRTGAAAWAPSTSSKSPGARSWSASPAPTVRFTRLDVEGPARLKTSNGGGARGELARQPGRADLQRRHRSAEPGRQRVAAHQQRTRACRGRARLV